MGEGGRTTIKVAAAVSVLALGISACGARLTDAQRAAGIGALARGGTSTEGPSVDPSTGLPQGPSATGVPTTGSTGGPLPSSGPTSAPEPPGGNGGATDVGITANSITISTIADVSGVQPGLFKSAHQAMQALVAMINAQGGIYGRQLILKLLDSKTDAGSTRIAVQDACPTFAIVGSVGAFDNGGAEEVDKCGIPDISAVTTTGARVFNRDTYPVYPNRPDQFIIGSGDYMRKKFPSATKKAAQLWLNTATTKSNAESKRKAYTAHGFDFIYTAETQVVESNYTPFVQKMKDAGVQFVTMLSDWQSIQRLTDAMRKQRWTPQVMEWDSVAYSPEFLKATQGSAEGSYIYLNTAMFEEVDKYPEMQLYEQWLARVAPGVEPDYFGLYAWSAGRLFTDLITAIGPKLTRAKLFDALKNTHSYDGHGLHAAHDIGRKIPSNCTMFAQIRNNAFVRAYPKTGFNCSSPLYPVK